MDRQLVDVRLPDRATQAEQLRDLIEATERGQRENPYATISPGTIAYVTKHIQALEARIARLEAERGEPQQGNQVEAEVDYDWRSNPWTR